MNDVVIFNKDELSLIVSHEDDARITIVTLEIPGVIYRIKLTKNDVVNLVTAIQRGFFGREKLLDVSTRRGAIIEAIIYLKERNVSIDDILSVYNTFHNWDKASFPKVSSQSSTASEPHEADVFIGLPQRDLDIFAVERVQNATGEFMEALGFELEVQEQPVFGSFYQRLKFLLKGDIKSEASELYQKGKTALELQLVSVPNAEATGKLADAASGLITSLNGIDEAAIRLGAILLVKVSKDGIPRILVETVSAELAILLDKNPQLLKNPNVIFDLISTMKAPAKSIEEEGNAELIE